MTRGRPMESSDALTGAPPAPRTLRQRVAHEMRQFMIMFLYLWALFGLFVLNESVVDRTHGNAMVFQGFALINALVMAKVMLLAELFDVGRHFRRWPLLITILVEAASYTVLFLAVHVLERVLVGLYHGESVSTSMPSFGGGGLAGLLTISAIVFVSLLPFFTFKHVARAIGPKRLQEILLHSPEEPASSKQTR